MNSFNYIYQQAHWKKSFEYNKKYCVRIFYILPVINSCNLIMDSFSWFSSKEGDLYWRDIHRLWINLFSNRFLEI